MRWRDSGAYERFLPDERFDPENENGRVRLCTIHRGFCFSLFFEDIPVKTQRGRG